MFGWICVDGLPGAESIDQHLRAAYSAKQVFEIGAFAARIHSIGDDQDRPFIVPAGANLVDSLLQRIVENRAATDVQRVHSARELLPVAREILLDNGLPGKRHQENIVLGMDVVDEAIHSFRCGAHLRRHAAAGVEKDSHAYGNIVILGEMGNLLRDTVFQDGEIVGGKPGNKLSFSVRDGSDDTDQPHIDSQLSRCLCSHGENGEQDGRDENCALHSF